MVALKEKIENSPQNVVNFDELSYMMRRLVHKARKTEPNIRLFGFHAIRHLASSVLNDSGKVNMKQLQVLLGHDRQKTTEIYIHHISGDLHEAMGVLD